jgi:hypothetical protein
MAFWENNSYILSKIPKSYKCIVINIIWYLLKKINKKILFYKNPYIC